MSKVQSVRTPAETANAERLAKIATAAKVATVASKSPKVESPKVESPKVESPKGGKAQRHNVTRFGHWADSTRGKLDIALDTTEDKAQTVQEIAKSTGATETQVRVHLGNLRKQQGGAWHHNGVRVNCRNGKYWVTWETQE